jgi:hypothetical protein
MLKSVSRLRTVLCVTLLVGLGAASGGVNARSEACVAKEATQSLGQGADPWTSGNVYFAMIETMS